MIILSLVGIMAKVVNGQKVQIKAGIEYNPCSNEDKYCQGNDFDRFDEVMVGFPPVGIAWIQVLPPYESDHEGEQRTQNKGGEVEELDQYTNTNGLIDDWRNFQCQKYDESEERSYWCECGIQSQNEIQALVRVINAGDV